jgi:hypothetical protein
VKKGVRFESSQRRFRFGARAAFLRLRTSNGFGRGAPLICPEDPPAIVHAIMEITEIEPHQFSKGRCGPSRSPIESLL